MITTDTTRMRSTHSASVHSASTQCAARLVGPALPWSGDATFMTQTTEQFGDRTPTTGPPRGTTG